MENMDKGLTVPKWVLIVQLKISQMSQNLSAQFVCPSPKVLDFNEKRLYWASVVREKEGRHSSLLNGNWVDCYCSYYTTMMRDRCIFEPLPIKRLSNCRVQT